MEFKKWESFLPVAIFYCLLTNCFSRVHSVQFTPNPFHSNLRFRTGLITRNRLVWSRLVTCIPTTFQLQPIASFNSFSVNPITFPNNL